MKDNSLYRNLFVFEMANNHMGSLEHGLEIIREFGKVSKKFKFKFGFKLQYRDLDTFIHPDFKGKKDVKYVKRFEETRLSSKDFKILKNEIKRLGFFAICTPFDENSVDLIEKHDYDIVKIASCASTDWPLLEKVAKLKKPVILSTAGTKLEDIDKVVAFFEHREIDLCLMHCVGEYPTENKNLELNQISFLKKRYEDIPIGYSTHENPGNLDAIKIAVGKGAVVFERHVGVKTKNYNLNAYSSTPEEINNWLLAAEEAFTICGVEERRTEFSLKEIESLRGLKRGVFAKDVIKKGEMITLSKVFLAIPNIKGQLLAKDMSKYREFNASKDIKESEPVLIRDIDEKNLRDDVLNIICSIKDLIVKSNISFPRKVDFELSHHYGIENFKTQGAAIMNCINREYCKKLIIMLPNQKHPNHWHKKKEETFHILYGDVSLDIDGEKAEYKQGDVVTIKRGQKHSFSTERGVIIEEISTTHYIEDSFYDDKAITENNNRKTEMTFWSDWLLGPII